MREDRTISWVQLQQCILSKVQYLMKNEAPIQVGVCVCGGSGDGSRKLGLAQERQEFAINECLHCIKQLLIYVQENN